MNKRFLKKFKTGFVVFFLLFTGCTNTGQQKYSATNVEQAWIEASVYLPDSSLPKKLSSVKLEQPFPVVVYLHGCTGITSHDSAWAKYISKLGFIVVLPNSMARQWRESNCDGRLAKITNKFPLAHVYRQQEIELAWNRLQSYNWVMKDKIFLMGHSEGGVAVATTTSDKYKGQIISGWGCTDKKYSSFNGIKSPKHIPVLAIADRNDFWHKGTIWQGQCSDQADSRLDFTQIDMKAGGEHSTYQYSEARMAVSSFLKRLTVD